MKGNSLRHGGGVRWTCFRWVILGVIGALAAPAAPKCAVADVFELNDGRRIEGTVVREFDNMIAVRTKDGFVTLDLSDIKRRRESNTTYDDYLSRKEKIDQDNSEGHLELARWCLEKTLDRESIYHFKQVLTIDPNHAVARDVLGYERVKSEWYLKGSPEAEQARRGEVDPFAEPVQEVPDDFDVDSFVKSLARKGSSSAPPVSVSGRPRVRLVLKESVGGKPPEVSAATHLLSQFLRSMEQPMAMSTGEGESDYVMELELRVSFQRTQFFYKRVPLYHIYRGEAKLRLYEPGKEGAPVVRLGKFTCPFSATVELAQDKALVYAYHKSVKKLLHRLSEMQFFKTRGARAADPDDQS